MRMSKYRIPPEGDIWFLGVMVQEPYQMGRELLGHRCRRRRRLETQVDIQARKLYLKFLLWFWDPGERYLRMETGVDPGVLHRISMQIS